MKIKIGQKVYSSNSEPVMIILEETDKFNIFNTREGIKFCAHPSSMRPEQIHQWLKETGESNE